MIHYDIAAPCCQLEGHWQWTWKPTARGRKKEVSQLYSVGLDSMVWTLFTFNKPFDGEGNMSNTCDHETARVLNTRVDVIHS